MGGGQAVLVKDCVAKSSSRRSYFGLCFGSFDPADSFFLGSTYIDIANGNSAGHFCGIVGGGWVGGRLVVG